MAKKPNFPNWPCPKWSKPIHIKTKQHECGWVKDGNAEAAPAVMKRGGKKKKARAKAAPGGINLEDIKAVKDVVERLGAVKVQQLAEVFAK